MTAQAGFAARQVTAAAVDLSVRQLTPAAAARLSVRWDGDEYDRAQRCERSVM